MAYRGVPFHEGKRINKRDTRSVSVVDLKINKRAQWQNYLLPAIMAVLVLGISFYFIFNEYFTGDDIDREVCRQSIIARGALPDFKVAGTNPFSLKDDFPLKCKTNVVEITEKEVVGGEVDRIIGETMAECWFLFDNGDINPFPSTVFEENTACMPCARIHLTEDAKKAFVDGKIDIEGLLNDINLFDIDGKKTSYLNYLNGAGRQFYPFNPMGTGEFNLGGDKFSVEMPDLFTWERGITWEKIIFPKFKTKLNSDIDAWGVFADITLPKYFDVGKGDLIIAIGTVTTPGNVKPDYVPYLFYFQNGQENYIKEMEKYFFHWGLSGISAPSNTENICNVWEGIPA